MSESAAFCLILASSSPRRKELLEAAGVSFSIHVSDVDETPLKNEKPEKMVARLSLLKAKAVLSQRPAQGSEFILAADTTVVSDKGKNLGKPVDHADAVKMVSALQGKKHHVFTAYTILKIKNGVLQKKTTRTVRTDVYLRKLSKKEVLEYVNRGESMDKAGAYGAQGFGKVLVEKINGSYTNVVGLPIAQVLQDLNRLGHRK